MLCLMYWSLFLALLWVLFLLLSLIWPSFLSPSLSSSLSFSLSSTLPLVHVPFTVCLIRWHILRQKLEKVRRERRGWKARERKRGRERNYWVKTEREGQRQSKRQGLTSENRRSKWNDRKEERKLKLLKIIINLINVTQSFTISRAEVGNKQKLKLEMISSLCKKAKKVYPKKR